MLEKSGRLSYSDTVYRAPSLAGSTTTTLVRYAVGPGPGPVTGPGINEDRTAITINTVRVKKEKQDTTLRLCGRY
jgi:hypothetical protein